MSKIVKKPQNLAKKKTKKELEEELALKEQTMDILAEANNAPLAVDTASLSHSAMLGTAVATTATTTATAGLSTGTIVTIGAVAVGGIAAAAGGGSSSVSAPTVPVTPTTPTDTTAPVFTSSSTATPIAENSGAAQVIYTATATDANTLTYTLKSGSDAGLTIDSSTGAVTLTANPDFETKPNYSFTVIATDTAGNAASQAVAITVTDVTESRAGESVIDLGDYGKLIAPVQVEGKWYYYWDRSGDGTNANSGSLNGGTDYTTHDVLDSIFTADINGNTHSGDTTDTYRYATLNGVHVALPTYNGGVTPPQGNGGLQNGTAYTDAGTTSNGTTSSFNELLAIWDAYNGTGTGTGDNGTPPGWAYATSWSATRLDADYHYTVNLYNGFVTNVGDRFNFSVALQVL